jgi:hypothetical protein
MQANVIGYDDIKQAGDRYHETQVRQQQQARDDADRIKQRTQEETERATHRAMQDIEEATKYAQEMGNRKAQQREQAANEEALFHEQQARLTAQNQLADRKLAIEKEATLELAKAGAAQSEFAKWSQTAQAAWDATWHDIQLSMQALGGGPGITRQPLFQQPSTAPTGADSGTKALLEKSNALHEESNKHLEQIGQGMLFMNQ